MWVKHSYKGGNCITPNYKILNYFFFYKVKKMLIRADNRINSQYYYGGI
jgi:hypothetical protein